MHADGVKKFKIIVKNEKKSYYMNFKNKGKLIINAVYIRVLFEFGIVLIPGIWGFLLTKGNFLQSPKF